MRGLLLVLLLACTVLFVLLLLNASSRGRRVPERQRRDARWRAANVGQGGQTLVVVELTTRRGTVLETRSLTSVADTDPDYEASLLEGMARARARADVLNVELRASQDPMHLS